MMKDYRIEANQTRDDSFAGAKPVDVAWADTLPQARRAMEAFKAQGYYSAVFIGRDGEVVMESHGEGEAL